MNSQLSEILQHLQNGGSLTPIDALERFGCFRLGARIWDLRQLGYEIQADTVELPGGKRVARYSLPIPATHSATR